MNTVTPEEVGFSSERLQRVSNMMKSYVDSNRLAGTVVALARNGKTFHMEPTGKADLASGRPMQVDNIFRIYSMTKPITSVAAMMLYEEGNFHIDDPISRFIPQLDNLKVYDGMGQSGMRLTHQQSAISIRHLLTHTSGLACGGNVPTISA